MARQKRTGAERLVEIPCKVPPEAAAKIAEIADLEDRPRGYVARRLVLHGLAAVKNGVALAELDDPFPRESRRALLMADLLATEPDGYIVG